MTRFDWLVLIVGGILLLLQFWTFQRRKKHGKGLFHLTVLCAVFWGLIFYFFYGFPLDEGTISPTEVWKFELGFGVAIAVGSRGIFLFLLDKIVPVN